VHSKNSYALVRFGKNKQGRRYLEELQSRVACYKSEGLADRHYEQSLYGDSKDVFFSRLWELNLAERLWESGHKLSSMDKGPDFLSVINGRNIWFEAISPCPMGLPEDYIEPFKYGDSMRCGDVPFNGILLRITSSIREKSIKFSRYISDGIVGDNDVCVIAVDTTKLGIFGDTGVSQLPFIVEATYPVGPLQISIDIRTGTAVDSGLSFRPSLNKQTVHGHSPVQTDSFLTGLYPHISAVIGSYGAIQRPYLSLVHNLTSTNPMPVGMLKVDQEFVPSQTEESFSLTNVVVQEGK